MSRAKDSALEEARVTREKLIKREQKLTTAVQEKAEAQSQVADLTADIAATRKKLETAKKKLKLDEESLKAARTELERVKEECRSLTEYKMRADAELAELKTKLSDLDATHAAKLTELEAAQSTIAAQTEAISQLESAVAAAEARIEEQAANHAIAVRLTKQMNRELKVQLAAEAKRVARLERDLASAHKSAQQQGGYNHLPNQHQHQHSQSSRALGGTPGPNQGGASGASPGPGGGFGVGGGMGGAGTTPARPGVASAGTATPASAAGARGGAAASLRSPLPMGTPPLGRSMSQQVPHTHSSQSQHHANRQQRTPASASGGKNLAPMGGGNMEETVRLLGTRLQAVLAESETAREKVKMLESIIQGLTEELAEKRRLLKQLTGSKADGDMETEAKKVVASAASGENPVNMLSRLLENALKDNARLKREQKTIAQDLTAKQEAFQRLQEETQQLQSALAAARAAPANGDESGSLRDDAGSQYTGRDSVPLPADDVASMSDYPPSERDSVVPVPTEQATAAAAPDDAAHNNPFG
jgi:chromosome segregation ATPase